MFVVEVVCFASLKCIYVSPSKFTARPASCHLQVWGPKLTEVLENDGLKEPDGGRTMGIEETIGERESGWGRGKAGRMGR